MEKSIPNVTSSEAMAALVNKMADLDDLEGQYLLGIGAGLAMAQRMAEEKEQN